MLLLAWVEEQNDTDFTADPWSEEGAEGMVLGALT